jgi:serine/threonine-protein kinase
VRTLQLGTRLGPYRLLTPLGDGGVGAVYRAQDEQLERQVALKVLLPSDDATGSIRRAFLDEARAMAEFDHPRLVRVYSYGESGEHVYLVMELVRGTDLKSFVEARGGRLPPHETLQIVADVAEGLTVLHRARRIHGDVKPGNVMVDDRGRARLTDLGLSHRLGAVGADLVRGTPAYMAPERACGLSVPPGVQARQDVYALAAVTFELLTGRLPFESDSTAEMLSKHACTEPPAPSAFAPELGPAVDRVLLRGLEKRPSRRWPGPRSFARALRDALRPPRRVWVVDDDADHAAVLAAILTRHLDAGAVRTFRDPVAALEAVRAAPPELLVVDYRMPGMDGLELIAHVRRCRRTHALPIVVVTGHGSAREWQRLHAAGADACLLKPVVPEQLTLHVDALLGPNGRSAPGYGWWSSDASSSQRTG